jgi:phage terminase large subunit-like protein
VRKGTTFDNAANLAPSALAEFRQRYEGTRLGRQELFAEILDDVPGALWNRAMLDESRAKEAPRDLQRIVVAIDPATTSGEDSDETGIMVVGRSEPGHFFVLEDLSCRLSPDGWARRAVSAFDKWQADRIVAEANQGGEMVENVIRTVRPNLPVFLVRASRGKRTRAEPIAALYEQGKVHHVGGFAELEDQMCSFAPDLVDGSPDRVDALVWGLTELSGRGGMVLNFDRCRNNLVAVGVPAQFPQTVIGCRIGVEMDAISVLSWERSSFVVHLKHEWEGPKQTMTKLAERLRITIEKYKPLDTVVDPGEFGEELVHELCSRYRLSLGVAKPRDRFAAIALLNDAMTRGLFLADSDGAFARETQRLEWDRSATGKSEIVGSSAIVDAVLAAYLRAQAWLFKPADVIPQRGTPEWAEYESRILFEKAQREVLAAKLADPFEDWGGEMEMPHGLDISKWDEW